MEEVKSKLLEKESLTTIAMDHFSLWCRNYRAFQMFKTLNTPPRNDKSIVIVIYGTTGLGKSKWCAKHFPKAYWKPKGLWWDGYNNEEVTVVDEFYGWLPWDYMLRVTDRYPLLLESKGGHIQFTSNIIIFTSNKRYDAWYPPVS